MIELMHRMIAVMTLMSVFFFQFWQACFSVSLLSAGSLVDIVYMLEDYTEPCLIQETSNGQRCKHCHQCKLLGSIVIMKVISMTKSKITFKWDCPRPASALIRRVALHRLVRF
jgi:hypothetical protein